MARIGPTARLAPLAGVLLASLGCSGGGSAPTGAAPLAPSVEPAAVAGTWVQMNFAEAGSPRGFYAAPFPSDHRLLAAGVDIGAFPNPDGKELVARLSAMVQGARGFGTTSAVFFSLTAPLSTAALPGYPDSVAKSAPLFLLGIDPGSPDFQTRYPISASFLADGGPFGAPNLLAVLPLQGAPLRPRTSYAAVILRELGDADGKPLGVSLPMAQLAAGVRPEGLEEAAYGTYKKALAALASSGVAPERVAGLSAFTTDEPAAQLAAVTADMLSRPLPAPAAPFARAEIFDSYCVYRSTIAMPVYQAGQPPFTDAGGAWAFDAAGKPVPQGAETANFVVTVPRRAMPPAGFPLVVFSRTGGGGDRPLVDRGPQAATGGPALVAGAGPALHFARAGFAGASIDGPLGGLRNTTNTSGDFSNEDFTTFNVTNPAALRDNVRQSAAELALCAHILDGVTIDASSCPGVDSGGGPVKFDTGALALMGHSMGATIAPLALAVEPRFRAAVLSGAGGSWIENVVFKKAPVPVRGLAELLLGLKKYNYHLTEYDPLLSLFQWACEPADPPVYARQIVREPGGSRPRHVLMLQGIVDHYILPSIANAASLSIGLDLAGPGLDAEAAEIQSFTPLAALLPLAGRGLVGLPASGNVTGASGEAITAVVVQHLADGVEDGHEIAFQTDAPKHQYRCFLESLLRGTPTVPPDGLADDPCP